MIVDLSKLLYIDIVNDKGKLPDTLTVYPQDAIEFDVSGVGVSSTARAERLLIPWTSIKFIRQPMD